MKTRKEKFRRTKSYAKIRQIARVGSATEIFPTSGDRKWKYNIPETGKNGGKLQIRQ